MRCPLEPTVCVVVVWLLYPSVSSTWRCVAATLVDEPCVIDGNLVSGRTFWDHGHYMGPWMKLLDVVRTSQET